MKLIVRHFKSQHIDAGLRVVDPPNLSGDLQRLHAIHNVDPFVISHQKRPACMGKIGFLIYKGIRVQNLYNCPGNTT